MGSMIETRAAFASLDGASPEKMFKSLPTPCYIIDEAALKHNVEILSAVMHRTGCRILLAQKAFSNYDFYPLLSGYLSGTEASGLYEARLGKECMPKGEIHVFCGAYRNEEFEELLKYADHIVFNSPNQLAKFGRQAKRVGKSIGLRINPECSTQEGHAIYDPCAPGSRLGTTRSVWDREMTEEFVSMLDGLHFHTLCEQDSDALETTLQAVEKKFGDILPEMKWLNMGGGHHITRNDYDISRLEKWENSFFLAIWQFIPPAKTIRSMACLCRISGNDQKTAHLKCLRISGTKISKTVLEANGTYKLTIEHRLRRVITELIDAVNFCRIIVVF